jgi:hypothetical protein
LIDNGMPCSGQFGSIFCQMRSLSRASNIPRRILQIDGSREMEHEFSFAPSLHWQSIIGVCVNFLKL